MWARSARCFLDAVPSPLSSLTSLSLPTSSPVRHLATGSLASQLRRLPAATTTTTTTTPLHPTAWNRAVVHRQHAGVVRVACRSSIYSRPTRPTSSTTPIHKNDFPGGNEQSSRVIIRHLLGFLWPKDDRAAKVRVLAALSLLLGGKVRVSRFSWRRP